MRTTLAYCTLFVAVCKYQWNHFFAKKLSYKTRWKHFYALFVIDSSFKISLTTGKKVLCVCQETAWRRCLELVSQLFKLARSVPPDLPTLLQWRKQIASPLLYLQIGDVLCRMLEAMSQNMWNLSKHLLKSK